MLCFIIGSSGDEPQVASLGRLAAQLGYETSVATSLPALGASPEFREAERPLVIVPDGDGQPLLGAALDFAGAESAHAFLLYIAETLPPDSYKRLVRTGSGEWVSWAGMPGELIEIARKLAGRAAAPDRAARIVSCWPSKGGVGNTTLAAEIGVHLAGRRKRGGSRVAIFDLNFQGGTLADLLDVEPRFDVREMMGRPERLDEQLTDIFTTRHSAKLDVFASPIRPIDMAEIDPRIVFTFMDAIAERYDLVVADLPHHWLPWVDNVLLGSDVVVLSGGGTVPAVKQLGAKLARLDAIAVPAAKVAVAVVGCEADVFGRIPRRAEIDKALPDRRLFYIRRDAAAVEAAHDMGRPLMELSPSHRVTKDIKRLAEWVESATERTAAEGERPRTGAAS